MKEKTTTGIPEYSHIPPERLVKRVKIISKIQGNMILSLAIIILSIFLSFKTEGFFTTYNLINVLRQISLTSLMAIGFGIVVITGGMDISMGNVAAMVGMTVAGLFAIMKVNLFVSLVISLALGLGIGLLNGAVIAYLGVPPFIATLAMMFISQGITFEFTQGYPIYEGLTSNFLYIGQGYIGPLPVPVIIMIAMFILAHFFLNNTVLGQHIYSIGGNENAARVTGVNVSRVKLITYGISGFFAALTGVVMTARLGSAQPAAAGMDFFLTAATAAVLGGTELSGGVGNMLGILLGALFLGILNNGLTLLKISAYFQWIVTGILLILAIVWHTTQKSASGGKY
ncbi:MAG: ribose ABC transporter permease [Atribacterota bacterium]|nr:ribose ABC transporter permease [Candidatus Atribacteria bacterium]